MCKVLGMGIDLCAIDRMEAHVTDERFLQRFFTETERLYIRSKGRVAAASLAGIFAAKEAFLKAVGTGLSIPLTDVGVTHTALGQPVYALTGRAAEIVGAGSVMLSITHEENMAAAVCIWQGE
ncbi:MAG: holo-ACP synthase [Clostridia bacterium]|nr:holo-ACP synthase [Clostridia bacterium]